MKLDLNQILMAAAGSTERAAIVTANNRLARKLREQHARQMLERGQRAWRSPDILPYHSWLARCFERAADWMLRDAGQLSFQGKGRVPRLLSVDESQSLWEQIIRADEAEQRRTGGVGLLLPEQAAAQAAQANALLHSFGFTLEQLLNHAHSDFSADVQAFARWCTRFHDICDRHAWLDGARIASWLQAQVIPSLDSRFVAGGSKLYWLGFAQLTPEQAGLLRFLESSGVVCRIDTSEFDTEHTTTIKRLEFENFDTEIDAVASWCRLLLDRRTNPGSPSIAVVVPNLTALRDQIEARFSEHLDDGFMAEARDDGKPVAEPPFELSLGRPLSREGVVADALALLWVAQGAWPEQAYARLLHSPYLVAGDMEWSARSSVERRLRSTAERTVTPVRLASLLSSQYAAENGAPMLAERLSRLAEVIPQSVHRQKPSAWAEQFWECLKLLGWPGERALHSREYQAVQAFEEALQSFAVLDGVLSSGLNAAGAVAHLSRVLQTRVFQPRRNESAPIQIMGVLEASGQRFDHMWIMGLDGTVWPPPRETSPLLPLALQRQPLDGIVFEQGTSHSAGGTSAELPRATLNALLLQSFPGVCVEADIAQSRRLTDYLLGSAHEVVVSHARMGSDIESDTEQRPSEFFAHIPCTPTQKIVPPQYLRPALQMFRDTPKFESVEDSYGPPLAAGALVSGGLAVLKEQAICPFRAFAFWRLRAGPMDIADTALDRKTVGIAVHRCLQEIFSQVDSRAALAALTPELRSRLVNRACDTALKGARRDRQLSDALLELEHERLVVLVNQWLDIELERPDFEIEAIERGHRLKIGELFFDVRLDRLDRLSDGRMVLIDYKTGNTDKRRWLSDRLDEPQLPAYTLAFPSSGVGVTQLAAVSFARLKPRELAYDGVSASDVHWRGVQPVAAWQGCEAADLEELIATWHRSLEKLSGELRSGLAVAMPKDRVLHCEGCDARGLCRIDSTPVRAPAPVGAGARTKNQVDTYQAVAIAPDPRDRLRVHVPNDDRCETDHSAEIKQHEGSDLTASSERAG